MNEQPDLFASPQAWLHLPLPDADVRYLSAFYNTHDGQALFDILMAQTPWRCERVTVWGRQHWQPRLTAWCGDAGLRYAYSGSALDTGPWTPTLLQIREAIETASGHAFNSVLINLYRDGQDSMGWHSDNEPALGVRPVIASLTLGATRRFRFKTKQRNAYPPMTISLAAGSLLVMAGDTQTNWLHAIDKDRSPVGARINLTFRHIVEQVRICTAK